MINEDYFKSLVFSGLAVGRPGFQVSKPLTTTIDDQESEYSRLLLEPKKLQRTWRSFDAGPEPERQRPALESTLASSQLGLSLFELPEQLNALQSIETSRGKPVEIVAEMILRALDSAFSQDTERLGIYRSLLDRLTRRFEHSSIDTIPHSIVAKMASLQTQFSFSESVKSFLHTNGFLLDLLTETAARVNQHFGATARLRLEVFEDPDEPEEQELVLRIGTDLTSALARRALNELDEDWWLEASSRSDCKMNIALDY